MQTQSDAVPRTRSLRRKKMLRTLGEGDTDDEAEESSESAQDD